MGKRELPRPVYPIIIILVADRFLIERFFILQAQIESTPFIKYACEKLFPLHTWKLIGANDSDRDQQHLRVLKVFAEMSAHCGKLDEPADKIAAIYNVLQVSFLIIGH